jgi:hypothetical protein
MFVPRRSVEHRQFYRVSHGQRLGTSKWTDAISKQMRRLTPPRNDGVITVLLAAMFLVGMTLGSVLSAQKIEPIQIASMD